MHTHHSWQILFERHVDCFDLLNFILLFDKAMLCSKEVNFQFKNSLFEMFLKFKAFPIWKGIFNSMSTFSNQEGRH